MNSLILSKTYTRLPFCEREILRYVGCREADGEITALMQQCMEEVCGRLTYKLCYRELPVITDGSDCDFGVFRLRSEQLSKNLKDCRKVIVFAATVGVEIDRLIARYGRLSPAKALMLQAIGAERIEALCDRFCKDLEEEENLKLRPRFSPGYGDLDLEAQKDIFAILECPKRIGLSLNDSLLMTPSKSVTAFAGVTSENINQRTNKCSACDKADCSFRSAI